MTLTTDQSVVPTAGVLAAVDAHGRPTGPVAGVPETAGLKALGACPLHTLSLPAALDEDDTVWARARIAAGDPPDVALLIAAKWALAAGDAARAAAACASLALAGEHPAVHRLQAFLDHHLRGRPTAGARHSARALSLAPNEAWLHCEHGYHLTYAGRGSEGLTHMRRAAALAPEVSEFKLNPLWYAQYLPGPTRRSLYEDYRAWAERFCPDPGPGGPWPQSLDPARRLRVGYLSPDFYESSLYRSFEPILEGHDPAVVEVFGYSTSSQRDAATARACRHLQQHRSLAGLSLEAAVEQVRADRIDLLVALGGHVTGNALAVLGRRAAPVQVDWGGISTNGLSQIDYRITDVGLDPPETQAWHTERLVHLPGGFPCFRPPVASPPVTALPALRNGHVTFGSFNNPIKINAGTLDLWAAVLRRVPESRLLMKYRAAGDPELRRHFEDALSARGVDPVRVTQVGAMHAAEHLACLGRVDLALDTTPFSGCVTTMEALWMGVPTVTLTGDLQVARAGANILRRVGLEVFVADAPVDFADRACALASQAEALARIRAGLRGALLNSPLCRPGRIAGEIEQAYRAMWQSVCQTGEGT